jgi:hypothetical protein
MNVQELTDRQLKNAIKKAKTKSDQDTTFQQYGELLRERNTRSGRAYTEKQIMSYDIGGTLFTRDVAFQDLESHLAENGVLDVDLDQVKKGWRIASDAWNEHQLDKAH